jgi:signal transduction histidine kinase
MRSVGLPVEVAIEGEPRQLPAGVDLSAYRIVQEALTNVLRHANASHASVQVRAMGDTLDIDVIDDGPTAGGVATAGLGLRGMSERSAALGGQLDVGPLADSGWRVHAVLPLGGGDRR